jgi:hypothetical protein
MEKMHTKKNVFDKPALLTICFSLLVIILALIALFIIEDTFLILFLLCVGGILTVVWAVFFRRLCYREKVFFQSDKAMNKMTLLLGSGENAKGLSLFNTKYIFNESIPSNAFTKSFSLLLTGQYESLKNLEKKMARLHVDEEIITSIFDSITNIINRSRDNGGSEDATNEYVEIYLLGENKDIQDISVDMIEKLRIINHSSKVIHVVLERGETTGGHRTIRIYTE